MITLRRLGLLAAAIAAVVVLWMADAEDGLRDVPDEASPPTSAQPIGPEARAAASLPPARPGAAAPSAPPGLDFAEPADVARAYLVAAYSLRAEDRGTTNRRVLPFLAPNNPDNPRGLVVVDAPPPGQVTTARVDRLRVSARRADGTVIAFRAEVSLRDGAPTADPERRSTYVVLGRQDDGRWLVVRETSRLQPSD